MRKLEPAASLSPAGSTATARLFLVAAAAVLFLGSGCSPASRQPDPVAVAGVIDLRDRDLDATGVILLQGQWQFYWQELLEPADFAATDRSSDRRYVLAPGEWRTAGFPPLGYGTYRLLVRLDREYTTLALNVRQVLAYRLWVNGTLYGSQGRVTSTKVGYEQSWTNKVYVFEPRAEDVEIIVQTAAFTSAEGGLKKSVHFGTEGAIQRRQSLVTGFLLLIVGAVVMIGAYHGILYLFRRADSINLIFAAFALRNCERIT
jgi:hypothetical protein